MQPTWDDPVPPKDLTVYTAKLDARSTLWNSRVLGKSQGAPAYKIVFDQKSAGKGETIWIHDARGPRADSEALAEKILAARYELLIYNSSALPGFFALRFGMQILQGNALLEKVKMVGLLVENRGKFLQGLRVYLDWLPKVEADIDGGSANLMSWRLILGRAINWRVHWVVINRIDVVPKIGVWSSKMELPVARIVGTTTGTTTTQSTETYTETFEMKLAPSLGIEVGIEKATPRAVVRAWSAFDYGLLQGQHIITKRIGLDGYWTRGPEFRVRSQTFNSGVMGFGILEQIGLKKPEPKEQSSESVITTVDYRTAYLGLGLVLAW